MIRNKPFNDWGKTHKQFSMALFDAGKHLTDVGKIALTGMAEEFLDKLDANWPHSTVLPNGARFGGDKEHPWYTGQLHDSVAIRVADANKTVSVRYMRPAATGKQYMSEGRNKYDNIIGAEWAREVAETKAPYYFLPGVQLQLIVGVPYAEKVNKGLVGKYGQPTGRHYGFIGMLSTELIDYVDTTLPNILVRERYVANPDRPGRVSKIRSYR